MSGLPGPVIGAEPSGPLMTKDAALFFICPALTRTHCRPPRRERERVEGGYLCASVCVCVCVCINLLSLTIIWRENNQQRQGAALCRV